MKKTTKKPGSKPKAKATKDLEVKPARGAAVRGGGWDVKLNKKI